MVKGLKQWFWVSLVVVTLPGRAEGLRLESEGVRTGFSHNLSERRFLQIETFLDWSLPWCVPLGKDWVLLPELDVSAGWLTGRGSDAFVGTVGPRVLVRSRGAPFDFVAGVSPTYLSEFEFGDKDFGVPVQFTSYLGFEGRLARHVQVGYRFQHMSNAGFSSSNPGLNLHMFTVGWEF